MAEDIKATDNQEEPVDWEAKYKAMQQHSREWEKLAKANKNAADELEKMKAAQMSETEKAEARAQAAEAALAEMKAELARADAAKAIAEETGVPVEFLEYCSDEDAMREFAEKFAKRKPPVAPNAVARVFTNGENQPSNADKFAEFAEQLFH